MAVDYDTLEAVAESGLWYTILSDEQVQGDLSQGAGPYKVRLGRNRFITVFVRDRGLSNGFSFNMPPASEARGWVNHALRGRRPGSLTLLATDGETFGHHHRHGVEVLRALTTPGVWDNYEVTTLGHYLRQHPPQAELEVVENTAWSCGHHLGRWATGCGCTPGQAYWKGALRRALDNLSRDIDDVYAYSVRRRDLAPWSLRDGYISVLLGEMDGPSFLAQHYLGHLSTQVQHHLLQLLEAQVYRQRMFTSCAFFFEDLERIEPRYAIANAIHAIALVRYATGDDLTRAFRRDLSVAVSPTTGRTGAEIMDELMDSAQLGESPLGGAMELTRPDERGEATPPSDEEEAESVFLS
jgi:alpha-amylase/alpha-mannosidase (GH57 family)